jgi:hypothetical protein
MMVYYLMVEKHGGVGINDKEESKSEREREREREREKTSCNDLRPYIVVQLLKFSTLPPTRVLR